MFYKKKFLIILSVLFLSVFGLTDVKAEYKFSQITGSEDIPSFICVSVGNITYFINYTEEYGDELWRTDGTMGGTYLVKDINPGSDGSIMRKLYAVGDTIYFSAYTNENGRELWKSDGTTAGTVMIKELGDESSSGVYSRSEIASINNIIYFSGNDDTTGYELYRSDGTAEGTYLVKDIIEGLDSSYLERFIVFNNNLYFDIENSSGYVELWKSDGTAEGTVLIKELSLYMTKDSRQDLYAIYNNELYFGAYDEYDDAVLWKTDGTTEGTVVVNDNTEYTQGPFEFVVFNNKLYFTAIDENDNQTIRMTDGNNVEEVSFINALGTDYVFTVQDLFVYNNSLYYVYRPETDDTELWKTDGTLEGTSMLKDIYPGSEGSFPNNFAIMNNKLYFKAFSAHLSENEYAYELWESDGTEQGTVRLKDYLYLEPKDLRKETLYASNNKLYFAIATGFTALEGMNVWNGGVRVWVYSNTSSYTITFKDYNGNILKTQTVEEGKAAIPPSNPKRTGYTFTGWDKTFNNITNDLTITAKYSINSYTVTFKDYDGTILKTQSHIKHGSGAQAPENFVRDGYTFTGWNKDITHITNDLTVTAMYELTNTNEEPQLVIDNITADVIDNALNTIKGNIKIISSDSTLINVYDVSLIKDGQKVQPNGNIEIRILMTEKQKQYSNLQVIYIDDLNNVTVIPHTIDENYIVFTVNHLSKYAVIGEKQAVEKPITVDKVKNYDLIIYGSIISIVLIFIIVILFKRKKKSH